MSTAHAAGFFDNLKNELEEAFEGVIREQTKEAPDDTTEIIEDKSQEPVQAIPEKSEHVEADSPRYDRLWITEIQTRLNQLGYNAGPADGIYGNGTRRTLERFQRDAGLGVTGLPTPSVMESLRASSQSPSLAQPAATTPAPSSAANSPPAGNNSQSVLVFEAQDRLNQLGYDTGQPDGKYGSKTATAVRAFQSDNNLPADGRVTPSLIAALRDAQAGGGLVAPAPVGQATEAPVRNVAPGSDQQAQPTVAVSKSDGEMADAAFRQLPEAIQNRIIDEATKYQSQCATSSKLRAYSDCDCVKEEFIRSRTVQGPDEPGDGLFKDTLKVCVAPKNIAHHEYVRCDADRRNRLDMKPEDIEAYCRCYGESMSKKFVARPAFTSDFLRLLHKESYKECDYQSYRIKGNATVSKTKSIASVQSHQRLANQPAQPAQAQTTQKLYPWEIVTMNMRPEMLNKIFKDAGL